MEKSVYGIFQTRRWHCGMKWRELVMNSSLNCFRETIVDQYPANS